MSSLSRLSQFYPAAKNKAETPSRLGRNALLLSVVAGYLPDA